jgi:hypothetical protein
VAASERAYQPDSSPIASFSVTNVAALEGTDPFELSWLDATGSPVRLNL